MKPRPADCVTAFINPSQFLKNLKAREISLLAKKMIKWNSSPFKRLMLVCLKRKGQLSFVESSGDITSHPQALLPSCCSRCCGGAVLLKKCHSSPKPLDLKLVCLIHCWAEKRAPGGTRSGQGAAGLGGPIHTALRKFYISFSNPDPASEPNAAPKQCRQR